MPDLSIRTADGDITVEVKAPYEPSLPPTYAGAVGSSAPLLAACLDEANRQFSKGCRNVLVLVPHTTRGFPERRELIEAFFGNHKIVVPLDLEHGEVRGSEARSEFFPDGRFLKLWGAAPRFTRTSAILCLGETHELEPSGPLPQNIWVDHHWLVLHNPFCLNPVGRETWGACPQLVRDGEVMRWTDAAVL